MAVMGLRFASTDSTKGVIDAATNTASEAAKAVSNGAADAASSVVDAADAAKKFDTSLGFDSVSDAVANASGTEQMTSLSSDQLGYLHSVGLADGWWPSDIFQEALELVHVYTGMPWWVTITVATIGFRLVLFPLFMKSSDTMAKQQAIAPQTKKLREEMSKAANTGDTRLQQVKMFEMRKLNKQHGIKYRDMFMSPVLQMTFAMGAFFGVREMCNLPVDGFTTGGDWWFQDLTVADPFIGLQLLSAFLYSGSFALGGDTATASYGPAMKKVFLGLPFVSILFTWNLASGTMVYLTANGLCSVIQSQLLRSPGFRKWAKMTPLNPKAAAEAAAKKEKVEGGVIGNMTKSWKDMQENAEVRAEMEEKGRKATEMQRKRARATRVVVKKRK